MMNDIQVAELAAANGNTKEIGTSGLEVFWGQVEKADNSKLYWPTCYDLFNKFLRRDPQVAQWHVATASMASKVDWHWELPQEDPTPTETAFLEFLNTIWDDLPGGQRKLIDTYIHYILMGWMWFENVPGRRNGQRQGDWVSVHEDGLVGFADIAFRDHSSFTRWDINENTGKLFGFIQNDFPNPEVMIPIARSTHVTLGDPTSPEGLSPFEALWRLESFMYNLEIVFGIGAEHSAGHIKFQSDQKLTATDHTNFQELARAIMSAVEGNYLALPGHIAADVIDVPFSAGATVLEAIKFYGHLKSQVLNMQWMSLSLTGDAGSNASMMTSSSMWLTAFNAQMSGAAKVIGEQLARQLRDYNRTQFGAVKKMPVLKATPVETNISLTELAQFVTAVFPMLDTTPEDEAAVRRKSAFLPEIEISEIVEDDEMEPDEDNKPDDTQTGDNEPAVDDIEDDEEGDREFSRIMANAEFIRTMVDGKEKVIPNPEFARPVAIGKNQPTVTTEDDLVDLDDEADIERMIRRIEKIDPLIGELLRAEEADEE